MLAGNETHEFSFELGNELASRDDFEGSIAGRTAIAEKGASENREECVRTMFEVRQRTCSTPPWRSKTERSFKYREGLLRLDRSQEFSVTRGKPRNPGFRSTRNFRKGAASMRTPWQGEKRDRGQYGSEGISRHGDRPEAICAHAIIAEASREQLRCCPEDGFRRKSSADEEPSKARCNSRRRQQPSLGWCPETMCATCKGGLEKTRPH